MKNYFKIGAWLCAIVAGAMMLLGIIAVIAGGRFLEHRWANYFYPAYNFLLAGIFLLLFYIVYNDKKE
ncbi:MAG TPA: hypothetical protein VF298_00225 [Bacteroidales bacterium]|jgi:hypothetical protein